MIAVVWVAGGWGAAHDLGYNEVLGEKISEAHAEGILLGSVCRGALGFLMAADIDGSPLVEGRTMTVVSNTAFRDFFATYVAVDGNIVTGQNQHSSGETANHANSLSICRLTTLPNIVGFLSCGMISSSRVYAQTTPKFRRGILNIASADGLCLLQGTYHEGTTGE